MWEVTLNRGMVSGFANGAPKLSHTTKACHHALRRLRPRATTLPSLPHHHHYHHNYAHATSSTFRGPSNAPSTHPARRYHMMFRTTLAFALVCSAAAVTICQHDPKICDGSYIGTELCARPPCARVGVRRVWGWEEGVNALRRARASHLPRPLRPRQSGSKLARPGYTSIL